MVGGFTYTNIHLSTKNNFFLDQSSISAKFIIITYMTGANVKSCGGKFICIQVLYRFHDKFIRYVNLLCKNVNNKTLAIKIKTYRRPKTVLIKSSLV